VRCVARQLERAERAGEGQVMVVVEVALVADAQDRVLAHQVLDQGNQRGIRPGAVDADQLRGEQRMQRVDLDAHPAVVLPAGQLAC
jgi:hypothetical protein